MFQSRIRSGCRIGKHVGVDWHPFGAEFRSVVVLVVASVVLAVVVGMVGPVGLDC